MDASQFDALTRTVSRMRSRRRTISGLLGGVVGLLASQHTMVLAKKKKPCPPCKTRKKGKCKSTLPDGTACEGGTCQGGLCVIIDPPPPPPPPAACGDGGPCLVFLSSSRQSAKLGGLSGADTICQKLAMAAGLPGTYKAWLSDFTSSVSSRFVPNPGPYRLVNGTQVAASYADLTDGTLLAGIDVTETGGTNGGFPLVFTGTLPNGNPQLGANPNCVNWTSDVGSGAQGGYSNDTDGKWTTGVLLPCENRYRLYCFQQR